MSELFLKDQSVIARHIANIFKEGELEGKSNMQILHNTFSKYKPTKVYNLNVIISVGYRVKSHRGTQFRSVDVGNYFVEQLSERQPVIYEIIRNYVVVSPLTLQPPHRLFPFRFGNLVTCLSLD